MSTQIDFVFGLDWVGKFKFEQVQIDWVGKFKFKVGKIKILYTSKREDSKCKLMLLKY